MTSHDAVAIVRKASKIRKIGHTGTLDPIATGLLVLCVGSATRLQSYLMGMDKTYEGTMQFGWATDTYDSAGSPLGEPVEASVESIDFEPSLERFRGELDQMPPAFSAKKIQGIRAYELARKGETPELKTKRVRVDELTILSVEGSRVQFRARCSAGTYVRSIVHELGEMTGIPAHLSELRRTAIGEFGIDGAVAAEDAKGMSPDELLAPPHFLTLAEVRLPLQSVVIDPMQESKLRHGQSVIFKSSEGAAIHPKELVSVMNLRDELVAIAEAVDVLREGGGPVVLQPKVVLGRVDSGK